MKALWCRLVHERYHCPVPFPPGSGTVSPFWKVVGGIMRMQCLKCGRCWTFYPWETYRQNGYSLTPQILEKDDSSTSGP